MKIRLVTDSSANICANVKLPISYVPLKIVTREKEYVDTPELDVPNMLDELKRYKGTSSSACPSIQDWISAFDGSDMVLGASLSSNISGCYNAAMIAAQEYTEQNPDTKVFILDSLSTGPELELLLEQYEKLIAEELPFDTICQRIREYSKHTHLMFSLASVDNFVKNGRVNPLLGKALGILGLRIVGRASSEGTLELMHKCRGEKKALTQILHCMKEMGYHGGKVRISHSYNPTGAEALRQMLLREFPGADISVTIDRGLCCYYAEENSILVGFEDI